jgi:hypothetical protein
VIGGIKETGIKETGIKEMYAGDFHKCYTP